MLQHLLLILIKPQLIQDQLISLDNLAGRKAHRQARPIGVILDQMNDSVDAAVQRTRVILHVTEVLFQRPLLIMSDMNRVAHQLIDALILCRGDRNHRNPQHLFHPVDIDRAAVSAQLIHHIECNHHGNIHLQQLHREIEIALDVRRVHDIDDGSWLII